MSDADDTKICPFCAERIKAAAILCRYCDERLDPVISTSQAAPSHSLTSTVAPKLQPEQTSPLTPATVPDSVPVDWSGLGWVVLVLLGLSLGWIAFRTLQSAAYRKEAITAVGLADQSYRKVHPELLALRKGRKVDMALLSRELDSATAALNAVCQRHGAESDEKSFPGLKQLAEAVADVEKRARRLDQDLKFAGGDPFGRLPQAQAEFGQAVEYLDSSLKSVRTDLAAP